MGSIALLKDLTPSRFDCLPEESSQPNGRTPILSCDRILPGTMKSLDILWLNRMINYSVSQIGQGP